MHANLECSKNSLQLIQQIQQHLGLIQRAGYERDLPIGVDNPCDHIGIGFDLLLFVWFELLDKFGSTLDREELMDEPAIGFNLSPSQHINLIQQIDMRHFQVDHSGERHHAE